MPAGAPDTRSRDASGEVSKAGMEVAVGLERDLARDMAVRLTVTEHLSALGDRADVGAALGIRCRLRAGTKDGGSSR
jgi:hypothetical protein